MSSRSDGSRLQSIQALRAIAAISVAVAHAAEEAKYFFNFDPWFDTTPLGKGVDLFFLISGFIIYYSSTRLDSAQPAWRAFAYNRFVRVVPLYYVFTSLMVVALLAFPGGVKETTFDIGQIISSYTFVPYERYDGRIAPVLSLGWTLNYEVFFYLLFACSIAITGRAAALVTVCALTILALIGTVLPSETIAPFRAWTDNIILEFALGIGIAIAHERLSKRIPRSWFAAAFFCITGFCLLYLLNQSPRLIELPRIISAGAPAAMVLAAATLIAPASLEERIPRTLTRFGDSSYSLYLSHRFIQRPIQLALQRLPLDSSFLGPIYLVTAVLAALGVGYAVYLALERPLLSILRHRRNNEERRDGKQSSTAA